MEKDWNEESTEFSDDSVDQPVVAEFLVGNGPLSSFTQWYIFSSTMRSYIKATDWGQSCFMDPSRYCEESCWTLPNGIEG